MSEIKRLIDELRRCEMKVLELCDSNRDLAIEWEVQRLNALQNLKDASPLDWFEAREKARVIIRCHVTPDNFDIDELVQILGELALERKMHGPPEVVKPMLH